MQTDLTIHIHVEEDENDTQARAVLDVAGDHFEATGKARRNPVDSPNREIGEELAIARAMRGLTSKMLVAAQGKIERNVED